MNDCNLSFKVEHYENEDHLYISKASNDISRNLMLNDFILRVNQDLDIELHTGRNKKMNLSYFIVNPRETNFLLDYIPSFIKEYEI